MKGSLNPGYGWNESLFSHGLLDTIAHLKQADRMKLSRVWLALLFPLVIWAETTVLVIHSYHAAYPWTGAQNRGFMAVLDRADGLYPAYSTEYLDTKRRSLDGEYEGELVRYISSKYEGYRPDLIYVTDDNALRFMLHNRAKLFPDVPVVFSGINDLSIREELHKTPFRGVFELKKALPNLRLIGHLFPDEPSVAIVGDGSLTSKAIRKAIEQELLGYRSKNIRYYDDSRLATVLDNLRKEKTKTVLLATIGGFRDENGQLLSVDEVIDRIRDNGKRTIVSMEDTYIKNGVIGGYVVDGEAQGEEAGKIALAMLSGLSGKLIDDEHLRASGWIFDGTQIRRRDIVLPEEIEVQARWVNLPKTFYQEHETLIIGGMYVLAGGVAVLGYLLALLLYRSRRSSKRRERELRVLSVRLNKAQQIAHIGNWEWELESGGLWWSDEVYRIFGYEPGTLEMTYERFMALVHPEDQVKVHGAVTQALETNDDYRMLHRIIWPDGQIRYVREEGQFEPNEDGTGIKMVGTVHDVTEQQLQDDALQLQARTLAASEQKYRNLVENTMIGVYRSDLTGTIHYVNPALAEMLGYDSPDELIGRKSTELYLDPSEREKMLARITRERRISNYEIEFLTRNGKPIPVMASIELEEEALSGMIIDMREIKQSREAIEKLSKVVEQIDDNVVITDEKGIITYVNPAFSSHTGYTEKEALGKTSAILKSGQHDGTFYQNMWSTIRSGEVFRDTFINRDKRGQIYYEDKTITPIRDEKEGIVGYVSSGKDVTEEMLLQQEIARIASTDKLTGVYNRYKFEELFSLEVERARRFDLPLSLLLIDIDHFKRINDTYGHDVGDMALIYLANIVRENIRKIDIFARWGGEEFLLLCPGTDLQRVRVLAEKIRKAVEDATFLDVGHLTVSMGISSCGGDDTFEQLFKRADRALYRAKENGRNCIESSEMEC